ncbi:MAG: Ig family protein [Bryobacterales bacterium]|nr:Ig family protein [Bryobacterales bacterium]
MRRLTTLAIGVAAAALAARGQSAGFTITTTSLPTAIFGQPYTPFVLQTANDTGPLSWDFLPSGSGASGFVVGPGQAGQNTTGTFCYGFPTASGPPTCTGTVQTVPGVYTFTLQATSLSTDRAASRQFTLAVVQPLQITTSTLPDAAANQPYAFQIQATGGTGQFAWSITAGALPPGIVLGAGTGTLSGTAPNVTASYPFTVQLLDQVTQATTTAKFTINVIGGLVITTLALPDATVNQPYSFQLKSAGGGSVIWSVPAGSQLPSGFSLSSGGLLTGFGLSTGTFTFQIQAMDALTQVIATRTFTFNITLGPLHIVETSLPNANQNVPYRATLTPAGGIPPYRWSFDIASPQSLSINTNTGAISGTPPNGGAFAIPVSLRDSTGAVFSQIYTLNVFPAVSITTTSLPNGSPGVAYSAAVSATGGSLPYSWTVAAGSLPAGLSLNSGNGQISGTPTAQGTSQFTLQVADFSGTTAIKVFTITIGTSQQLTITTTSLPGGTLNQSYSQTLTATGGVLPIAWTVTSGNLPAGLALDQTTGVISGTPTAVGSSSFTVQASDAAKQTASRSLALVVAAPLTISANNITTSVGVPLSEAVTAAGGTSPYAFSVSAGTLPPGVQLNASTGAISGTPTAIGAFPVTFTVTDASGRTASFPVQINIAPLTLSITGPSSSGSGQQSGVSVVVATPMKGDVNGTLALAFLSSVGGADDMVRFSNGSRSLSFTIPQGATTASFPSAPNATVITGTVAGTIRLTASVPGSPDLAKTITIDPAVPVITSVTLQQVTGGVSVVVSGYSNTREVSSGSFQFTVSGASQTAITVPLTSPYATWFTTAASNATGGQFKLTVPFSVTQGSAASVTKVTVTLTNSKGASAAASSP